MSSKETMTSKLIELLADIGFDRKYYDYYEAHRDRGKKQMSGASLRDFRTALADTPLDFAYNSKGKFFLHEETHAQCDLALRVAFPYSTVELILTVNTKDGYVGGPFPRLARQVGQMRDSDFVPSPASPKLPFSNTDELQEVVDFGVSLFLEAKQAILTYEGWRV